MPEFRHRHAALPAHAAGTQIVTFVLRPTMSYRAIELGVPPAWLGVLGASFALAPLLLALPAGHAADRYGERCMAVAGALFLTYRPRKGDEPEAVDSDGSRSRRRAGVTLLRLSRVSSAGSPAVTHGRLIVEACTEVVKGSEGRERRLQGVGPQGGRWVRSGK
ncbi:hypothetical protein ACWDA3_61480 [Nonomuraea rubra]